MYPDLKHEYYTCFGEWWEDYSEGREGHHIGGEIWMASKAAWDYSIISAQSLIQKTMC